jgi:hypothetical protein
MQVRRQIAHASYFVGCGSPEERHKQPATGLIDVLPRPALGVVEMAVDTGCGPHFQFLLDLLDGQLGLGSQRVATHINRTLPIILQMNGEL